ncbi:MAG: SBBP repeat-containing protein, partial [Bacteroidia bacterium]|nr:SBBP repeat-containing protein [Bacteroidia bacterium]
MKTSDYLKYFLIIFLFFISVKSSNSQTGFLMGRQMGSAGDEYALNHVVDSDGNIYIAGKTTGIMDERNRGKND